MSIDERVERLEAELQKLEKLEHSTNFRLLLVALGTLAAALLATAAFVF